MDVKDTNLIIHLAADAGRIILESGGETYRVEETVQKICNSFNVIYSDSFVTPTGIVITITDNNGHTISLVKRVLSRTVNLEKISQVNDLSRKISTYSLTIEEIRKELDIIDNSKKYSNKTLIFFASVGASFFTLLFGGNIYDFFVSFIIGALIKWVSLKLSNLKINDFFINILGGSIAALIASISVYLDIATHLDKIIIGSIMLLVPGLAITNAIRDTIEGDLVSGVARAIEAFFIAVAIAVGTGIVLKLWFTCFGGIII